MSWIFSTFSVVLVVARSSRYSTWDMDGSTSEHTGDAAIIQISSIMHTKAEHGLTKGMFLGAESM